MIEKMYGPEETAQTPDDIIIDPYYGYDPDEYEPYDDTDDYYRSSTHGDYSPSHPWDAPGMNIRDFI